VSLGRIPRVVAGVTLCLALFATLLPGAPIAAAERRGRTYIVSLATVHAGSILRLSQRADRLSARQRATQSSRHACRPRRRHDCAGTARW
jgi:hypothetical protein